MSDVNSTPERTNRTDGVDVDAEEYLTARELQKIKEDPFLDPEDVVAHRRDRDGLERYDE